VDVNDKLYRYVYLLICQLSVTVYETLVIQPPFVAIVHTAPMFNSHWNEAVWLCDMLLCSGAGLNLIIWMRKIAV